MGEGDGTTRCGPRSTSDPTCCGQSRRREAMISFQMTLHVVSKLGTNTLLTTSCFCIGEHCAHYRKLGTPTRDVVGVGGFLDWNLASRQVVSSRTTRQTSAEAAGTGRAIAPLHGAGLLRDAFHPLGRYPWIPLPSSRSAGDLFIWRLNSGGS